ncbi:hypothetical protein K431DRAFT_95270 [Polychaeton citri CBS 116435]|uniref:Uncharacterized protein n=1 Tax=Polychaeton citri CBS 116435 TaxID=1314669 RepID=A0A9P4Q8U5_9PEZI|nr:hypothetical protein K431DRAFT_95270 [Polychaeton citri CBS 116435]
MSYPSRCQHPTNGFCTRCNPPQPPQPGSHLYGMGDWTNVGTEPYQPLRPVVLDRAQPSSPETSGPPTLYHQMPRPLGPSAPPSSMALAEGRSRGMQDLCLPICNNMRDTS